MFQLSEDLRLAARQFRRSPGFAAVAVLMLAFGIGSTAAIFSIVDGLLLRPLPFPEAGRLVTLGDQVSGTDWGQQDSGPVTGPEVVTYMRDTRAYESLGGFGTTSYELSGIGEPAQINAARMTPSVFSVLQVQPLMGRVFTSQEDEQKQQVAVLSYATWKARFAGDPHVVGTKVQLDRKPYIVIGVMPRSFEFPLNNRLERSELWVPMSFSPEEVAAEASASWYLGMVGRLKPGVSAEQAQKDAGLVAEQIMRNYPPALTNFRIKPVVYPLQQITVEQTRPVLRMLFLAVLVVMLIACANLAGLLLVRSIGRQRESALRLAMGASARALLRQIIVESIALSLAGGLLGIGLAALALAIGKDLLPDSIPLISQITLNWSVVVFALLLALLTGFFCGLAPGFAALHTNVNTALKEGGYSGSGSRTHARLRSALVVMEIAVALVLLCASGLLLRSFSRMSAVDLGFRPDHVATAVYSLPEKQYATQAQVDTFNNTLLQRLRQLPGVQAAGLTNTLPTTGSGINAFVAEGYVDPRGPDQTAAPHSEVIGDYFRAMGIPLIRGRYFNEADHKKGQLVVIVNREFAEIYWPHQDPIGKRMRIGVTKSPSPWMVVAGEVADAKLNSPDADAVAQYYTPVAQSKGHLAGNGNYIVLRSGLPPEQMEDTLQSTVHSIDAQLPLTQVQTMDQVVAQSEALRRFDTAIVSSFSLAAVLLAMLGVYSIVAFSVASRVREMAIRLALGSQRSRILRLVLFSGFKLAAVGCVLGLAGAAATSGVLRSFLFQVSPYDPVAMILTAAIVLVLALAASAFPAYRAAAVDPIHALRGE